MDTRIWWTCFESLKSICLSIFTSKYWTNSVFLWCLLSEILLSLILYLVKANWVSTLYLHSRTKSQRLDYLFTISLDPFYIFLKLLCFCWCHTITFVEDKKIPFFEYFINFSLCAYKMYDFYFKGTVSENTFEIFVIIFLLLF